MNTKSVALGFLLGLIFAGVLFWSFAVGGGRTLSIDPVDSVTSPLASDSDDQSVAKASAITNPPSIAATLNPRFKVRTLADAARKRSEGTYILDSEIEQLMTMLDAAAESGSELVTNTEWERYAKLLTVLGMSSDDQERMQLHFQKIVKAKLAAGQMATSLAQAQGAYEAGMRRLLGENFDLYRAYESEGLGRYEVRLFAESLDTSGSGTTLQYDTDQIFDLFSKYELYSPKALGYTGLPFQPNPTPQAGVFASESLKESMTRYAASAKALVGDSGFQQLAPELQQALVSYLEATGDQLAMDHRASIDPEFAYAMWKRNQLHTQQRHLEGSLKPGESMSSSQGQTKIDKGDDGG